MNTYYRKLQNECYVSHLSVRLTITWHPSFYGGIHVLPVYIALPPQTIVRLPPGWVDVHTALLSPVPVSYNIQICRHMKCSCCTTTVISLCYTMHILLQQNSVHQHELAVYIYLNGIITQ